MTAFSLRALAIGVALCFGSVSPAAPAEDGDRHEIPCASELGPQEFRLCAIEAAQKNLGRKTPGESRDRVLSHIVRSYLSLGKPTEAFEIAAAITDINLRSEMYGISAAATLGPSLNEGGPLWNQAISLAEEIEDEGRRNVAFGWLAKASAAKCCIDLTIDGIRRINSAQYQAHVEAETVAKYLERNDLEGARALTLLSWETDGADHVDRPLTAYIGRLIESASPPGNEDLPTYFDPSGLGNYRFAPPGEQLVRAYVLAGLEAKARQLLEEHAEKESYPYLATGVASGLAEMGSHDQALALLDENWNRYDKYHYFGETAVAFARGGGVDHALEHASKILKGTFREITVRRMVEVFGSAGQVDDGLATIALLDSDTGEVREKARLAILIVDSVDKVKANQILRSAAVQLRGEFPSKLDVQQIRAYEMMAAAHAKLGQFEEAYARLKVLRSAYKTYRELRDRPIQHDLVAIRALWEQHASDGNFEEILARGRKYKSKRYPIGRSVRIVAHSMFDKSEVEKALELVASLKDADWKAQIYAELADKGLGHGE